MLAYYANHHWFDAVDDINTLWGEGGDDWINGGRYTDTIFGGLDNDYLYGANGDDFVSGDQGSDILFGDSYFYDGYWRQPIEGGLFSSTFIWGSAYVNQELAGDSYDDLLLGGADNDYIFGEFGEDVVLGGDGNDYLQGDRFADPLLNQRVIASGESITTAFGANEFELDGLYHKSDTLDGGQGDDRLFGNGGEDLLVRQVSPTAELATSRLRRSPEGVITALRLKSLILYGRFCAEGLSARAGACAANGGNARSLSLCAG